MKCKLYHGERTLRFKSDQSTMEREWISIFADSIQLGATKELFECVTTFWDSIGEEILKMPGSTMYELYLDAIGKMKP